MSEPHAQEWPELEPCACGGAVVEGCVGPDDYLCEVRCVGGCRAAATSYDMQEARERWNAMQRVAKGEKEPDDAS